MTNTSHSPTSFLTLAAKASNLGAVLTGPQVTQIAHFCAVLTEWNEQFNLVANSSTEVLLQDHILDSLSLVPIIGPKKMTLIDIGSGAGFPALIVALVLKNLHVTLVEATNKKSKFLENAVRQLSLGDRVTVLNVRAEALAHLPQHRHQYDLATCRAVAELAVVLELTMPFLRPTGRALIQKSVSQYQTEERDAASTVIKLGCKLTETFFPDKTILGKERAILVFEQLKEAPAKYPRSWHKLRRKHPQ